MTGSATSSFGIDTTVHLAKVYLALADPATARQLLGEIDDILTHRPALGARPARSKSSAASWLPPPPQQGLAGCR